MCCMAVSKFVGMQLKVSELSPFAHCKRDCLTCQVCSWSLPFEDVVGWCAAAQRLKQIQRVAANAQYAPSERRPERAGHSDQFFIARTPEGTRPLASLNRAHKVNPLQSANVLDSHPFIYPSFRSSWPFSFSNYPYFCVAT